MEAGQLLGLGTASTVTVFFFPSCVLNSELQKWDPRFGYWSGFCEEIPTAGMFRELQRRPQGSWKLVCGVMAGPRWPPPPPFQVEITAAGQVGEERLGASQEEGIWLRCPAAGSSCFGVK